MQTRLTLRMDDALIRRAKRHSSRTGKSLSRLVADYFALMDAREAPDGGDLTPRVRSLLGALAGTGVDEKDYRRHLEAKHR